MKLSIQVANPAGNITIFVRTELPQNSYSDVARKLMAIDEYHAEQVAFIVPPRLGGMGRIEMMGGEFCGNATRSFGYLLSQELEGKPASVLVEVSGSSTPLTVEIDHKKGTCRTQMPLLQKIEILTYENTNYSAMVFDGIVHIIVPGIPKSNSFIDALLNLAKQQTSCDAYGIMFLEDSLLTPVVYVATTDSLIWEGSCGSGSLACAAYLSQSKSDGVYTYHFKQPGGIIEAQVSMDQHNVTLCKIGGPVTLSEKIQIEL